MTTTITPQAGAKHRMRVDPRSLTTVERRAIARLARHFQDTPPWTAEAMERNDAFRAAILRLHDTGVPTQDLAFATGWDETRIITAIRKARAHGLNEVKVTFTPPKPQPIHRNLTSIETNTTLFLFHSVLQQRSKLREEETALLQQVRLCLAHVSLEDMAALVDIPADTLRTRMKVLPVGRFRATPHTIRPLTSSERDAIFRAKATYMVVRDRKNTMQTLLLDHLRAMTADGVTQSTIAEVLGVTRKTVSEWLRPKPEPTTDTRVVEDAKVPARQGQALRRRLKALPSNAAGGPLWKSEQGQSLATVLWNLHQQGYTVVELARTLRMPPSVLGKVMNMYRVKD